VRSLIQTNVWEALETADVEIAYPHSHLYFDDTSGELQVSMRDQQSGDVPPTEPAHSDTEQVGKRDTPTAESTETEPSEPPEGDR
jgi:hypothetical protein